MRLSDRDIHSSLQDGSFVVVGPNPEFPFEAHKQVQPCSIDLRLDNRFTKFKEGLSQLDVKQLDHVLDFFDVFVVEKNQPILLRPNDILFGQIYEQLRIPPDSSGKIVGRSRFARLGLSIHATGDFINPEFEGAMPLQLINHSRVPIILYPFITICQLILVKLSSPVLVPYPMRTNNPFNREKVAGPSNLHTDPAIATNKDNDFIHAEVEKRLVENYLKEREQDKLMKRIVQNKTEVIMGDRIDITNTGTISNVGGQLLIGKFSDTVATLTTAGHHELGDALKQLAQAVSSSKGLTDQQKSEHVELIGQVAQEAAQKSPNKTKLKTIFEGLMSVLKSVPDVAGVLNTLGPTIKNLLEKLF